MDKKLAGLLGAAAALTTLGAAQAAPAPTQTLPSAANYADLLEPVPNAVTVLAADDQRLQEQQPTVQLAQYHHHHHHHHVVVIHRRHHHHHHIVIRRHRHHHHHHHHVGFGVYVR
jgi:hypothetical protein